MKKTIVRLGILAVSVVTLMSLMACPVTPTSSATSTSSTTSTTSTTSSSSAAATVKYVHIYVATVFGATNLFESIANTNNAVFIAGDLSNMLLSNGTRVLVNWSDSASTGALSDLGGGLWRITYVCPSNNVSINFKFLNGTPGWGGAWNNQEQQIRTNVWEDKGNRGLDLISNSNQSFYFTNAVTNTNDQAVNSPNGINKWKGVGPTYACTAVTLTLVVTNLMSCPNWPAMTNATGVVLVDVGTNLSWMSYGGTVAGAGLTNAVVSADGGKVIFTFTYTGAASFSGRVVASENPAQWAGGHGFDYSAGGNDLVGIIPTSAAAGGSYSWTNARDTSDWRGW